MVSDLHPRVAEHDFFLLLFILFLPLTVNVYVLLPIFFLLGIPYIVHQYIIGGIYSPAQLIGTFDPDPVRLAVVRR